MVTRPLLVAMSVLMTQLKYVFITAWRRGGGVESRMGWKITRQGKAETRYTHPPRYGTQYGFQEQAPQEKNRIQRYQDFPKV